MMEVAITSPMKKVKSKMFPRSFLRILFTFILFAFPILEIVVMNIPSSYLEEYGLCKNFTHYYKIWPSMLAEEYFLSLSDNSYICNFILLKGSFSITILPSFVFFIICVLFNYLNNFSRIGFSEANKLTYSILKTVFPLISIAVFSFIVFRNYQIINKTSINYDNINRLRIIYTSASMPLLIVMLILISSIPFMRIRIVP